MLARSGSGDMRQRPGLLLGAEGRPQTGIQLRRCGLRITARQTRQRNDHQLTSGSRCQLIGRAIQPARRRSHQRVQSRQVRAFVLGQQRQKAAQCRHLIGFGQQTETLPQLLRAEQSGGTHRFDQGLAPLGQITRRLPMHPQLGQRRHVASLMARLQSVAKHIRLVVHQGRHQIGVMPCEIAPVTTPRQDAQPLMPHHLGQILARMTNEKCFHFIRRGLIQAQAQLPVLGVAGQHMLARLRQQAIEFVAIAVTHRITRLKNQIAGTRRRGGRGGSVGRVGCGGDGIVRSRRRPIGDFMCRRSLGRLAGLAGWACFG